MKLDLSTIPTPLLVVFVVFVLIEVLLDIVALVVLVRTPTNRVTFQRKWPWVLVILLINIIGAVLFIAIGRRAAPASDTQISRPDAANVSQTVQDLYGNDRRRG